MMKTFSYILFYKPFQVLSQFSAEGDKKTLANFFSDIEKNIYPVGRLDYDSEGLILLTNDTKINQQLLSPAAAHQKTYYVQVEGIPSKEMLQQLTEGVIISVNGKPHKTAPAKVSVITEPEAIPERNPPIRFRKNIPTSWIALSITEGKNRQVRKMTAAVGLPTLRLIRQSIGSVEIGSMQPGEFIYLRPNLVKKLFLPIS
ncbi:pseudouridine synthase [Edaphocola aurantiacus]|uniref:pseudouridine synthase n=1 Tax=Edaphocola aurantiacus TaxID=2601682 RepID=UPI001FE31FE8|nr:pseudouridine synthase [Edaphocola aurantiacus]